MNVLVLYEELATYFLNCLTELAQQKNAKIFVVMKRINSVAPFEFKNYHSNITIVERESLSVKALELQIKEFNPDCTYLAGWLFKPYLNIIKKLNLRNVIIGFDNQYKGSMRQLLGAIYFRLFIKPHIYGAFVPGKKQKQFAKLLGFSNETIAEGLYCCDIELYNNYYQTSFNAKSIQFPKRFLFVGRYVNEKGITELWDAFIELQKEKENEWELWCLGKGNIASVQHPKIKHFGFKQPKELENVITNTSVFVLPSHFEPWGVVIQEYAAAGFPIITTTAVGAAELFLNPTKNGFLLQGASKTEIKEGLRQIMNLSNEEINEMSVKSHSLAQNITPASWCNEFLKLVKHGK
jgi:glycosyltransferase involved in cell wall biosynthesis